MLAEPASASLLPLSYAAMRLRWCLAALRAFVKRWGVYLGMAAMAFGAGATGGLAAVGAVAAWTVLPLCWVVARAQWTWSALASLGLMLVLQTAAGVALLRALRPMLWPAAWRDSEAALPLTTRATRHSDIVVSAFGLLLWWVVQGLGAATLLVQDPPWLRPVRAAALSTLLLTQCLAWALGLWGLQRARGTAVGGYRSGAQATAMSGPPPVTPWWWALLMLPITRGVAKPLGAWWLAGLLLMLLPALAVLWRPGWAPGAYAAWAVLALALTSRLNHLSRLALGPLLDQAGSLLPLSVATMERVLRLQLLLPAMAGAVLLLAFSLCGPTAALLRPAVLATWTLVAAFSLWWASGQPPRQADEAALRWLLSGVVLLALSCEILK